MKVFDDYTIATVWKLKDQGFEAPAIAKMCGLKMNRVVTILHAPRPLPSRAKQETV